MIRKYVACFWLLIIFLMINSATSAQTINAQLTTSVYTWQQRESDSTKANHVRAYETLQLSLGKLGLPELSFHTFINLSHDMSEKAVDDPRVWIYSCYFNLNKIARILDLSIGRQRIFAGVGQGTIDGIQLQSSVRNYMKLKIYAGILAPLSSSTAISDFALNNLTGGIQLSSRLMNKVNIGISFMQKSRIPERYDAPGVYTGTYRMEHPLVGYQQQLLGMDFNSLISSRLQLGGRVAYHLAAERLNRVELSSHYVLFKNMEFEADYFYRRPLLDLNSIFSIFSQEPNHEIYIASYYRWKNCRYYMNFSTIFYNDADVKKIGIGGSWKAVQFGYSRRTGYWGDSDGFHLDMRYSFIRNLNFILHTNFISYQKYAVISTREEALAGSCGLNYVYHKNLFLQSEIQVLRNELFSYDVRFFFRGSYRIFHRI